MIPNEIKILGVNLKWLNLTTLAHKQVLSEFKQDVVLLLSV